MGYRDSYVSEILNVDFLMHDGQDQKYFLGKTALEKLVYPFQYTEIWSGLNS